MIIYILEIFILLLGSFVLGWLISYLTYRVRKQKITALEANLKAREDQLLKLNRDYNQLKSEFLTLQHEKSELEDQLSRSLHEKENLVHGIWEGKPPEIIPEQSTGDIQNTKQKQYEQTYNLTSIEGIDEQVEMLLQDAGIHSLIHLANSSVDHLKKLLEKAGDAFKDYNPEFWPDHAKTQLK